MDQFALAPSVERYIKRNGIEYLREKITLTELEPRENAARYFMAALRDDFKLPVRREPEKKQQAKRPTPPFLEAPPALTEEERTARMEMMRELRQTIAACRS